MHGWLIASPRPATVRKGPAMKKKSLPTTPHDRNQDEHQHAPAHFPSLGLFDLAKPSRLSRKLKRGWRRKTSGYILAELLGLIALGFVAAVLLMGVM